MNVLEDAVDLLLEIDRNVFHLREFYNEILLKCIRDGTEYIKTLEGLSDHEDYTTKIVSYILYNDPPDPLIKITTNNASFMYTRENIRNIRKHIRNIYEEMYNNELFTYIYDHIDYYIGIVKDDIKHLERLHNRTEIDVDNYDFYSFRTFDEFFITSHDRRLYDKMMLILKLLRYKQQGKL